MVSRDTTVQTVAVVVAMTLGGLSSQLSGDSSGIPLLLGAASYIVVFAGSHIYLALRGNDEMVPVTARRRFVALVALAATAIVVGVTYGTATVAGARLSTLLGIAVAILFMCYWLYEARDGYVASRRQ